MTTARLAGVSLTLLLLSPSTLTAQVAQGDLLCFDSQWGALFKYDMQTGAKTLISGCGNGPDLVGDGPIWPVSTNINYSRQRLHSGSDGTVFLASTSRLYAVDPMTGNRRMFEFGGHYNNLTCLSDPADPDKVYVFAAATSTAYERHRDVYELTLSTGSKVKLATDFTIPPDRNPGWTFAESDPNGRIVFVGGRWTGSVEHGAWVYGSPTGTAIQQIDTCPMYNLTDIHFDSTGNRLLLSGDFGIYVSQLAPAGDYAPIAPIDIPTNAFTGLQGLCNSGGRLLGIDGARVKIVDIDARTTVDLPNGPGVGYGFAAPPGRGIMSGSTILGAGDGEFLWVDPAAGNTWTASALCQSGNRIAAETPDSIYYKQGYYRGPVTRYDKATGEEEEIFTPSDMITGLAMLDSTHFAYTRGAYETGCFVYDTATQTTQKVASEHLYNVYPDGHGGMYVLSKSDGFHKCTVERMSADGQEREVVYTYDSPSYSGFTQFVVNADEEVIYFVPHRELALYSGLLGGDTATRISGCGAGEYGSPSEWVGTGPSWGGGLVLYGIADGFAYLGDSYHNGLFRVDLATGERELLSATEYYRWVALDGICTYIPGPATLSLLALGGVALLRRRKQGS